MTLYPKATTSYPLGGWAAAERPCSPHHSLRLTWQDTGLGTPVTFPPHYLWRLFSSGVIHGSDVTPLPTILPSFLLVMLRSVPLGILAKVPGHKNLCHSIISHFPL